ncbi:hypothetical protein HS048_11880 [Planomonospora sp. ID91781]|uniref:Uncharacterized protein n=4 Tax=Streptosporangiaceae TaxID=2004 RepID=A0A161LH94_9ACTN|nr:hypothetical protein [Planomonospora sphaerica]MBG0821431.1 hypothetical protein [Planomonospora sp. ID91781]GAT66994.1 hypothetical protein PS9374_02646 [Planomonospora sphaerica]GGK73538.1 hypothetical protein GCM10010126_36180 [Planomonospora parontospora]GII09410.1 hypothetical protein Ppa06_32080 [Planomonospora parontospora subsp. parontospora]
MHWRPTATARLIMFDPEGLTPAQCEGDACVACHKRWPRPRVRIGRLPSEAVVLACPDCAEALLPQRAGNVYPLSRSVAFS